MNDKDLKKQLKELRNIKPNNDWAISARQNLVNYIDSTGTQSETEKGIVFSWNITKPRLVGAFALMLLLVGMGSMSLVQNNLTAPMLVLSGSFESILTQDNTTRESLFLNAILLERRVEQATKLALRLDSEDEVVVTQKLAIYKQDMEIAKENSDSEKAMEIGEKTRLLTAVLSDPDDSYAFTLEATETLLPQCESGLAEEIQELLDNGDVPSLIRAFEDASRCES